MKNLKFCLMAGTLAAICTLSSCITFETPDLGNVHNPYDNTTSIYNNNNDYTYIYQENTTGGTQNEVVTLPPESTTYTENTSPTPTESPTENSSHSKKEIVDIYAAALNKTRGYSGTVTAVVTEAFSAEIKEAQPGGKLTELLASNIVKLVGSEGTQNLTFTNGKAVNKDGETVPVLLPQRNDFSLPEKGIKKASISENGGKTTIKIELVSETVSMGEIPPYNAGAIGYLNTADMSFSIITISRVDICYTGSVIEAVIDSNGYIEKVNYTINMSTYAELSGMGISGYGTLEGAQTENWALSYN